MAKSRTRTNNPVNPRQTQLKNQRTSKTRGTLWRSLIAIIILGGLGWVLMRPKWIIRESSQIDIEGNQILSQDAVRNMIDLSYPQSIFQLPIPELDQQLENLPPLQSVRVTRQLLPPKLKVRITERIPVAIALDGSSPQDAVGFLDQEGILLPEKFYSSVKEEFKLPKLRVIGFKEENRWSWSQLYELINQAKIKVEQIDGRDSNNLILTTQLGEVYLGADPNLLLEQLKVLEEMVVLPSKVKIQSIDYIDLSNPSNPLIQVFEVKQKQTKHK